VVVCIRYVTVLYLGKAFPMTAICRCTFTHAGDLPPGHCPRCGRCWRCQAHLCQCAAGVLPRTIDEALREVGVYQIRNRDISVTSQHREGAGRSA
jgi:hypothetical protein